MKHTINSVLNALSKKNDARVKGGVIEILSDKIWSDREFKLIDNPKKKNDLGNKTWGKIDFLVNYCNYMTRRVTEFN